LLRTRKDDDDYNEDYEYDEKATRRELSRLWSFVGVIKSLKEIDNRV